MLCEPLYLTVPLPESDQENEIKKHLASPHVMPRGIKYDIIALIKAWARYKQGIAKSHYLEVGKTDEWLVSKQPEQLLNQFYKRMETA